MSTQRVTKYGIARRIRFLRGESTQEEFSRRVGITRSALANYESNRSTPNDFVLGQIASRCDIPASFFDDADLTPNRDWNTASFLGRVIEGRPDWTDDELSFVRLLRLVPADVVARIADELVEASTRNELKGVVSQFASLTRDVASVLAVKTRGGLFSKGIVDLTNDFKAKIATKSAGDSLDEGCSQ